MRIVNLANLQQFTAVNFSSDPGQIGGPVVIPQCAQIVLNWTLTDGKTAHNVLYGFYSTTFNGSVAQANALLLGLNAGGAWGGMAAFLATTTSLSSLTIRNVNIANQGLIQSTGGAAAGTSASPAMPSEVAVCLTERTALAGRSNRGRVFVPGWATNAIAAGDVIAAAAVTAASTWGASLITQFSAQGYQLVIGQKARAQYTGTTGTNHPARAAGSVPVISVSCRDNHWDSQRRRGLK